MLLCIYHIIYHLSTIHYMYTVLCEDGRVTGLLDFEFAAYDWRAMELAVCLSKYVYCVMCMLYVWCVSMCSIYIRSKWICIYELIYVAHVIYIKCIFIHGTILLSNNILYIMIFIYIPTYTYIYIYTHIYQHIHVYIDMLISPTKPSLYSHSLWPDSDPSAASHPQKSTSFRN